MEVVYVGIGSNLGDRRASIERAVERIGAIPGTRVAARASVRETTPVGGPPQPDYLNTVVAVETALEPEALLAGLRAIEDGLGRVRDERWGPRTVDLDILLFGDRTLDSPSLSVPHPRMTERRFVLEPLAELAPDRIPPGCARTVRQYLEALET